MNAATTARKTPVASIEITRAEGPARLCRIRTFKTWRNASAALAAAASTYPEGGAYDKHDFVVTFADGETYKMPATIDDPAVLTEIGAAIAAKRGDG